MLDSFLSLWRRKILSQFIKYTLVGIFTNIAGYAAYLLITGFGLSPKLTVTLVYGVSALINFLTNRQFTFQHDGHLGRAGIRYILAQLAGYLINLLILVLFVDWLGYPHQYIQAIAILVVAVFLFVLSRYFVFAPDASGKDGGL
ncbi:GtrA family protein [Castellaniella hirudinis]|uniref:GtrA family protein n=1 Tax=Castellaniella hirudinis TaxID=1144617 RepID=A0ABV8RUB2_9BURK